MADLKAHAESLCARSRLYAVLDSLDNLLRGGRISRARAIAGTLLNVKPLLTVRDGEVVQLENVRTRSKAFERISQLVEELGALEALAIVQADETIGRQLEEVVRRVWKGPIQTSFLGPVVGAHAGPAAGVVAITKGGA